MKIKCVPFLPVETRNKISFGLFNSQSINLKEEDLKDIILENKLSLFVITKSWLSGTSTDNASLNQLIPDGYTHKQEPRKTKGGGVLVVYKKNLKIEKTKNVSHVYKTLEILDLTVAGSKSMRLLAIYRPTPSRKNRLKFSEFISDFSDLLDELATYGGNLAICGDFNVHMDVPDDSSTRTFTKLIESHGYLQLVNGPTHKHGHTLDLVLVRQSDAPLFSNF